MASMNRVLKRIVSTSPRLCTTNNVNKLHTSIKHKIHTTRYTSTEFRPHEYVLPEDVSSVSTIEHTPSLSTSTTSTSDVQTHANKPVSPTNTNTSTTPIHTNSTPANTSTTNTPSPNIAIPATNTNVNIPTTSHTKEIPPNTNVNTTNITIPASTQPAHTIPVDMHTCEVAHVHSNSFYRRPLPDTLIAFSSAEGRKLFREALEQGYMEGYFALAEQFVSQSDPAYCGPATLSMCLNALNIDPNRLWKGPWRWFAEDMLDCCTPLDVVKKRGITFTEFACLAKCNGASVRAVRGDEASLDAFRQAIKEATSQESLHLVVSYSRKALGQTGQGHYSPVGGYHPEKDLALMLDVARFKYAPHWVPVETLWNSMQVLDEETKKPRGYYVLTRSQDHRPPAVCRITSKTMWAAVASHLSSTSLPQTHTAAQMVEKIVRQLPPEASQVLKTYPEDLYGRLPREHADMTAQFFSEISKSEMCTIVREVLAKMDNTPFHAQYGPEILGVLLLACPTQLFGSLSVAVRDDLARVRSLDAFSKDVQTEILQIREQMFLALKSNCKQCKKADAGGRG
eukprot:Phypoly_transcript_03438.p1 GENE.Phypoly_transcript_03438~~Phypoly_transcript_03438.p1  ORF type:complete len:567 (+),score=91.55 Phypoly_transcript_03438:620-2320(+)